HPLAARLEDAAEQVADECAAGVADVKGSGRVGRHELDVDRASRPDLRRPPPVGWAGEDGRDGRLQGLVAEAQVEEPGRRDARGGANRQVLAGRLRGGGIGHGLGSSTRSGGSWMVAGRRQGFIPPTLTSCNRTYRSPVPACPKVPLYKVLCKVD